VRRRRRAPRTAAGTSRRRFLLSVYGAAPTLLALNACADEATRFGGPARTDEIKRKVLGLDALRSTTSTR
jgi:hypothetical protein